MNTMDGVWKTQIQASREGDRRTNEQTEHIFVYVRGDIIKRSLKSKTHANLNCSEECHYLVIVHAAPHSHSSCPHIISHMAHQTKELRQNGKPRNGFVFKWLLIHHSVYTPKAFELSQVQFQKARTTNRIIRTIYGSFGIPFDSPFL